MKNPSRLLCLILLLLFCQETASYAFRRPSRFPEHAITLSALPAMNTLKFGVPSHQSRGAWNIGAGISYSYQWNENWGFSLGLSQRAYSGTIDLHGLKDSVHMVEEAGEKYFLFLQFQSTEQQSIKTIEPYFMLEFYQEITPWLEFNAGLGAVFAFNYSEEVSSMDGSYKKTAYFYENHNLIDDLPSMNLGEYIDFIQPLTGKSIANPFSARAQIGLRWNLSRHWSLITRASGQYSFNALRRKKDVFNHHSSYSGVVASKVGKEIRAISMGFEIGIQYRLAARQSSFSPRAKGNNCPAYQ